ncbi:MAG: Ig-like domain-containing protein [Clostridia bacterium]|nr:Ig-like domain-containing protein [Clostridia bacterium]
MKKIISLLIVVMISIIPASIIALASVQPTVTAESVNGKVGDIVAVKISLCNNPGLIAMRLYIGYNSETLELTEVSDGDVFGTGHAFLGKDTTANPYTLLWEDALATENYTGDGTLATLYFKILSEPTDSKTEIHLSIDMGSTFNVDLNEIPFYLQSGYVFVESSSESESNIYAENVTINSSKTFEVPVFIRNNPGLIAMKMGISYESEKLELIDVRNGEIFGDNTAYFGNKIIANPYNLLWEDALAEENYTDNGVLCTLVFTAKDVAESVETEIKFIIDQGSTFDIDLNEAELSAQSCNVLITKDTFSATFMANGEVVAVVEFTDGTEKLDEPDVPQKPGCIARWSPYELKNEDIVIYAEYFSPEAVMTVRHTLKVDESVKLLPVCNFKTLRRNWTSSNPDIATVDDEGKVTAISEGECEISVTCYGEDYFGNEIKAIASADIKIRPQTYVSSFKELIREIFDNFFKVKLHDLVDNLLHLLTILFRYAW